MPELLEFDDLNHLTIEVATGVPVEESLLPDTPLVRETRKILIKECAEIRARGHAVDIPF